MGTLGFEPRTSRLSAVRANQAEPRALIKTVVYVTVQTLLLYCIVLIYILSGLFNLKQKKF